MTLVLNRDTRSSQTFNITLYPVQITQSGTYSTFVAQATHDSVVLSATSSA